MDASICGDNISRDVIVKMIDIRLYILRRASSIHKIPVVENSIFNGGFIILEMFEKEVNDLD